MAVVRVNSAQFDRAARLLRSVASGVELAGSRAINDTLKFVRASAVRKIRERLNIKAKDIRDRIFLTKATRNKLEGRFVVTGARRLPVFLFGAKQRKKGVAYRIKKGRGRKLSPGAWINKTLRQVFVREFADTDTADTGERATTGETFEGGKRVGRRPIRPVFGPSIGHVFREEVQTTVEREAFAKLEERLDFHIDRLLNQAGR